MNFNPDATIDVLRLLLVGVISLVMLGLSVKGLVIAWKSGQSSAVGRMVVASLLALVPATIVLVVGFTALMTGLLDWSQLAGPTP